jgi:hypothetical protein
MNGLTLPDASGARDGGVDRREPPDARLEVGGRDSNDGDAGETNLATNGNFSAGCHSPWMPFNAEVSDSGTTYDGSANACLVCWRAGPYYTLDETNGLVNGPLGGGTYTASAWVRIPEGGVSGQTAFLNQRVRDSSGMQIGFQQSSGMTLTETWQKLSVTYTLSSDVGEGDWLGVFVQVNGTGDGACFLVDDITLYLE